MNKGLYSLPCLLACIPALAASTTEEVSARSLNQRVWNTTELVEVVDRATGETNMEEHVSQVVEVGDFLCYRDPQQSTWVPSSPRWIETEDGFLASGVGYQVSVPELSCAPVTYQPAGEEDEVLLRLQGLYLEEAGKRILISLPAAGVTGKIREGDATKVLFASALGDGFDVEIELKSYGIHQNVLFRKSVPLPHGLSPSANLVLVTELSQDAPPSDSNRSVMAGGQVMPPGGDTQEVKDGEISFCQAESEGLRACWAFGSSRVFDTQPDGLLALRAVAAKRLSGSAEPGHYELRESLPISILLDAAKNGSLPLVWDYETKQGTISVDTVWRGGSTYWVKDVTVSKVGGPVTLTIEPGATIKREPGTLFKISTNANLIAIGEPHAMITFTRAGDANCGEAVNQTTARPADLVQILQASSSGSAIQFCRFTKAQNQLLYLNLTSYNIPTLMNNVFLHEAGSYAVNVSVSGYPSMTFKNNLFVSASTAYAFIYAPTLGSLTLENNTFFSNNVNSSYAAYGGANTYVTAKENIFFNINDPISSGYVLATANAYKPNAEPSDSSSLVLTSSPFASCALLGDFYLAAGSSCRNFAGARTAQQAGLSDPVFTVDSPSHFGQWFQTSQTLSSLTVSRHVLYPNPTTNKVCLGYHAPRADALIGNTNTTAPLFCMCSRTPYPLRALLCVS